MAPDLEPTITLPWLVRLRWSFLIGQLVVLPIAHYGVGVTVGWWALAVSSIAIALSNLVLTRLPARFPIAHVMGAVLVLDIALMTLVFAASGGPMNPFTVFYLVHITLSAVVLDVAWTIALAVLAMAGFGVLFALPQPPHHHVPGMDMTAGVGMSHLQGMWAAFALASALTAFFVSRITRAIAFQRDQIATLREAAARNARLAALTTLAAGAAHELNNPLATIAVAAHEARLRAVRLDDSIAEDLRLILEEVDRCQHILHQMAARAEGGDAPAATTFDELGAKIRGQLGEARCARVELVLDPTTAVRLPSEQMAQSVVALIKNAIDASTERVTVTLAHEGPDMTVAIEDRGTGIAPEVLARIGEPFFTTKQPGRGLGLGVFLARAFFESRGGGLVIESRLGVGTTALARMPMEPA